MFKKTTTALACLMALFYGTAQENTLKESLIFYAPFNESTTAQVAVGDAEIYSASSRKELQNAIKGLEGSNVIFVKDIGLSGGALDFKKKGKPVVFFDAFRNMGYSKESWSGAISFGYNLTRQRIWNLDFAILYKITDVNYNDASIWVDFTKENPRDFRLGVIGDLALWNPENVGPDNNPALEKRLVRMKSPPFKRGEWTHNRD